MTYKYLTIATHSQGLYQEKGSKFISYAYPVNNQQDITKLLSGLQKQHHQARHYCYALVLGTEGQETRVNDDGEPRHSAGDPILSQIRALGLTNVLVVVVRYFGGTKLGLGGLVRAYKEAARSALENGKMVEKEPCEVWRLIFEYPQMHQVMRMIKTMELKILNRQTAISCQISVALPLSSREIFHDIISRLPKVKAELLS